MIINNFYYSETSYIYQRTLFGRSEAGSIIISYSYIFFPTKKSKRRKKKVAYGQ